MKKLGSSFCKVFTYIDLFTRHKCSEREVDMYVALYSRVSTSNQSKGLEAQQRALVDYCKSNKIKKYRMFSDENISGGKASRPGLDEMMKEVESGNIPTVIVYSFSRFARSSKHLITALEFFKSKDVDFVSLSERLDSSTHIGKMMYLVLSALAEFEKDVLKERILTGLVNAKAKGKKLGRPKQRPSELIITLYKEGYSTRKISKMVGFSHTSVHREIKSYKCKQNTSCKENVYEGDCTHDN